MEDFYFYFSFGLSHILNWDSSDHLLFIIALIALYTISEWKKIFTLITAFTVGHFLTLALSLYQIIEFNVKWVEFFIPITILITCCYNLLQRGKNTTPVFFKYIMAICFGLIHGMGFANVIRFTLSKSQALALPLISFNLGIEAGQLMVIIFILYIAQVFIFVLKMPQQWWSVALSLLAGITALCMCIQRFPL